MPTAIEIAPDIAILLAKTWQNNPGQSIDKEAVCRIWAFDLGWFNMETATRVRDNLIRTGWIDSTSGGVHPGVEILTVEVPFGWLPTMRLLESPPPLPKGMVANTAVEEENVPRRVEEIIESAPIDPASTHITVLLEQIANSSGLERKEVLRRAQRKRRALGPVTLWMALLLVAREQKLPMRPFMQTISS
jgi:hypothetical protein